MTFRPTYMRHVNLILGDAATDQDFNIQLRSAKLTPDTNITRVKTLHPDGSFANVDNPEWTLELGFLHGTEDAAGKAALADFLFDRQGTEVDFWFAPVAGGDGWRGRVKAVASPIGGEQGNFSEDSVSLPLDGQPVRWDQAA